MLLIQILKMQTLTCFMLDFYQANHNERVKKRMMGNFPIVN